MEDVLKDIGNRYPQGRWKVTLDALQKFFPVRKYNDFYLKEMKMNLKTVATPLLKTVSKYNMSMPIITSKPQEGTRCLESKT